ncbi:MAG: 16S rRNA (cytosine(1402)-N(4))-methyltransferase RsmH [Burkholderiales bacterium]|nr:16S rRNA (cytosine(1402)-N(4))-methyltransferase RsmH [Burkholderiales bacterium]
MHYSVLLRESVELLNINPDGIYIDGTFGRGGHSKAILERLGPNGKLIAFDKDPEAIQFARDFAADNRFIIVHDSFASAVTHLEKMGIKKINGILLDLGISSPQIDTPERGFSFRFDAPLDMRMNNTQGLSAADWLNSADYQELTKVFWEYGEEKFSRKIATKIVDVRESKPLLTTSDLAKLVESVIPYREKGQHPATRVFQATRIHINNELYDVEEILDSIPSYLAKHGRFVVISFHSLEDRIVKNKFAKLATGEKLPRWVMANDKPSDFAVIAKKIKAGKEELEENARSRSAVMRCLEKIHD